MDIKFTETTFDTEFGKAKLAIFHYMGTDDPVIHLDSAVALYTMGSQHYEFIDMNMDNPWVRIVTSMTILDITGDDFKKCVRDNRLDSLLDN